MSEAFDDRGIVGEEVGVGLGVGLAKKGGDRSSPRWRSRI